MSSAYGIKIVQCGVRMMFLTSLKRGSNDVYLSSPYHSVCFTGFLRKLYLYWWEVLETFD